MHPTRVAVGIVWYQGRILVGQRRSHQTLAGMDEFPGGKCLSGEPPEQAVVREVLEETGLLVQVRSLRQRTTHDYTHGPVELYFFDCEPIDRPPERLSCPFAWWDTQTLVTGRFPEANSDVIQSILTSAAQ